jgi:hypothetical protein
MSGGKSSSSSYFGDVLAGISEQINKEVNPVRKLMLGQMKQVLNGNQFTNSSIPLIQSGVSAARQAGAASLSSTQSSLATSGVAQSPFAAAIMSMSQQATNEQIGAVPGQVSGEILGEVPNAVSNIGGQALSGLAGAAQTNNSQSYSGWTTPLSGLLG